MSVVLTCVVCGAEFSVIPSRAKTAKYCNYKCHQIGEGRKGGETRGQQMKDASTGKSYPKIKGRHAHRIIAEQKLGRPLLPGEVVHHDDENKQNYSDENLIVLSSQAEHARIHVHTMLRVRKPRKINKFPVVCHCGKTFYVFQYRLKTAKDCSRDCHNKRISQEFWNKGEASAAISQ